MSTISEYMRDPEVSKVQLLCDKPERYAVRYEDGSAMLVDGDGNMIKSPLGQFDVVSKVEFIGRTRNMPETGMFDADGHQKLFRDPRSAGIEGVDYIKWEFEKFEKMSNDPRNSRRDDPFLVDIDSPKQNMRIGR